MLLNLNHGEWFKSMDRNLCNKSISVIRDINIAVSPRSRRLSKWRWFWSASSCIRKVLLEKECSVNASSNWQFCLIHSTLCQRNRWARNSAMLGLRINGPEYVNRKLAHVLELCTTCTYWFPRKYQSLLAYVLKKFNLFDYKLTPTCNNEII